MQFFGRDGSAWCSIPAGRPECMPLCQFVGTVFDHLPSLRMLMLGLRRRLTCGTGARGHTLVLTNVAVSRPRRRAASPSWSGASSLAYCVHTAFTTLRSCCLCRKELDFNSRTLLVGLLSDPSAFQVADSNRLIVWDPLDPQPGALCVRLGASVIPIQSDQHNLAVPRFGMKQLDTTSCVLYGPRATSVWQLQWDTVRRTVCECESE